jgi:hypothetical protein
LGSNIFIALPNAVDVKGGTWTVEDGKIRFTPDPGFVGKSTIKYQLTDSNG